MAKQKYYVVWHGKTPGIYTSWESCRVQVEGVEGSKYKAFKTMEEAQTAYDNGYEAYREEHPIIRKASAGSNSNGTSAVNGTAAATTLPSIDGRPQYNPAAKPEAAINDSIAVDAACSGNPGAMEYRGVYLKTGKEIFHVGPIHGTNNIGEFLALVHGLALLKQRGLTDMPIYSDSRNAQLWVRAKKCKTKLARNAKTEQAYQLIERAERWLATNTYSNRIIKWPTEEWGEIPADFGRKG